MGNRRVAKAVPIAKGLTLEFRFNVPDNLPEADLVHGESWNSWRLKVSADGAGTNLNRTYFIPVFKTAAQSRYVTHDTSRQAVELKDQQSGETRSLIFRGEFEKTALARALRFSRTDSYASFYFPMLRNGLRTVVALGFAAVFDVLFYIVVIGINVDDLLGSLPRFIGLVVIVPIALLATISGIYLPFNRLKVIFSKANISVKRYWLFFPLKFDTISNREITSIGIRKSGSTGAGVDKVTHYELYVLTNNKKKITIAENIDGEDTANHLKDYISERLLETV